MTKSFDPRPRGGSDSRLTGHIHQMRLFRSTPPRGERRGRREASADRGRVSIHAPAGGATSPLPDVGHERIVSIHAPAGGATARRSTGCDRRRSFDPRPRGGSDVHGVYHWQLTPQVSIHAPAGGATTDFPFAPDPYQFRSTPPRGERLRLELPADYMQMFRSTPPRGERRFAPRK